MNRNHQLKAVCISIQRMKWIELDEAPFTQLEFTAIPCISIAGLSTFGRLSHEKVMTPSQSQSFERQATGISLHP
jgi:hypothetical protein